MNDKNLKGQHLETIDELKALISWTHTVKLDTSYALFPHN